MELGNFLETSILEFLDSKMEKKKSVLQDREEDYGLYLTKDYLKELDLALENDEITKAKSLFEELKDTHNRLPKNSIERKKIYSMLEKMYSKIESYINMHYPRNTPSFDKRQSARIDFTPKILSSVGLPENSVPAIVSNLKSSDIRSVSNKNAAHIELSRSGMSADVVAVSPIDIRSLEKNEVKILHANDYKDSNREPNITSSQTSSSKAKPSTERIVVIDENSVNSSLRDNSDKHHNLKKDSENILSVHKYITSKSSTKMEHSSNIRSNDSKHDTKIDSFTNVRKGNVERSASKEKVSNDAADIKLYILKASDAKEIHPSEKFVASEIVPKPLSIPNAFVEPKISVPKIDLPVPSEKKPQPLIYKNIPEKPNLEKRDFESHEDGLPYFKTSPQKTFTPFTSYNPQNMSSSLNYSYNSGNDNKSVSELYDEGLKSMFMRDYDKAIIIFEKILETRPYNRAAKIRLVECKEALSNG